MMKAMPLKQLKMMKQLQEEKGSEKRRRRTLRRTFGARRSSTGRS